MYLVYDNLDEVTEQDQFDGDGVFLSDANNDGVVNAPDATLATKVTAEYDDRGRVFRTTQYNVDHANDAAYGLATEYWYDGRGNVEKMSAPGSLVTKSEYDGAGRLSIRYETDGGGDDPTGSTETWADAGNVTDDIVAHAD